MANYPGDIRNYEVFEKRAYGDLDWVADYFVSLAKGFFLRTGGCWLIIGDDRELTDDEKWEKLPRYSFTNWWVWLREN